MDVNFYADHLIERYYPDDLDVHTDLEISLLWNEVSTGFELLQMEKLDQPKLSRLVGMKPTNLEKLTKLCNMVNFRKCADIVMLESELTRNEILDYEQKVRDV